MMWMALLLGFAIGLRHAVDPDHVVAVSTIVAREGRPWRASYVGAVWGLGHGATILSLGFAAIALRIAIPDAVSAWAECGVGVVLMVLGVSNLAALGRRTGTTHTHFAADHSLRSACARSGLVGLVHGVAGSGAVTVLAATALPTPGAGLLYLVSFGLGTIAGMVACSTLLGAPFAMASSGPRLQRALTAATGVASLALGAFLLFGRSLLATSGGAV
jgi:hypothetical protein